MKVNGQMIKETFSSLTQANNTNLAVDLACKVFGVKALRACMLAVRASTSRRSLVGVSIDRLKYINVHILYMFFYLAQACKHRSVTGNDIPSNLTFNNNANSGEFLTDVDS